jgi:(p)ppGpp synthase/HD superfamily hydrolase
MGIVDLAEATARFAHQGQVDKAGQPYILHPQAVAAEFGEDEEDIKAAAWLHDVVEDTHITLEELVGFGFPPRIILMVAYLTHWPEQTYNEYIEDMLRQTNADIIRVKMADIKHNMDPARRFYGAN